MGFYNKIKWVLGILIVFVLIITTNLVDRNNFTRVKNSVDAIYEDRLVANDLIFEMSTAFQQKEMALATLDSVFFTNENKKINVLIEASLVAYKGTKLTQEEQAVFESLFASFSDLEKLEATVFNELVIEKIALAKQYDIVKKELYSLSKIQLTEGRRQMFITKKALDTVELFTQIEIYILIFLAIVVQIIVIYKPKKEA